MCVIREGLGRAMAERNYAAFKAAGALRRVESDFPRKLVDPSQASAHGIAEEGVGDESGPSRSAHHRGCRSIRIYAIGAAIGLLILGGGFGLLRSQGVLRMPGFKEAPPNTHTEKLPPNIARPRAKRSAGMARAGAIRGAVR